MRTITAYIISLLFITNIFAQPVNNNLKIVHLTGNFYVFVTYQLYQGSPVAANGMYLITNNGVVLFDTPWDTTQFQPLLDSIQQRHNKKVILCIATHFHNDRTGGLEYYRKQGIATYTTKQTDGLSKDHGMKRAGFYIDKDTVFTAGQYSFETFYPGPGHSPDNIVIWFNKEKILYGGCLIKSADAKDLGFLGDADVKKYAATIEKVKRKCVNPKYIIPGHDDWTNIQSLNHTLLLANQLKTKK